MAEIWVSMAACTGPRCLWSGMEDEAVPHAETGRLTCPQCRSPVTSWRVELGREQAALRRERAAVQAQWWKQYQAMEETLAAQRVQSEPAKMRCRVTMSVTERHGGGRYDREERRHLRALIERYQAQDRADP